MDLTVIEQQARQVHAPPDGPPVLPDRMPVARHLDAAAALAFRTPIQEHVLSADGKAAGVLTLLGIMFTVLARCSGSISIVMHRGGALRVVCLVLLTGFALMAVGAVVQAFRTITPRFPATAPSLAFFGDIATLSRDDYLARVTRLSGDEALRQMLAYNHTAARIAVEKFRQLRRCLTMFEWGFLCWLPLVCVLGLRAVTA